MYATSRHPSLTAKVTALDIQKFEVSKGGPKRREVVTQFSGSHTRLPRSRGRPPLRASPRPDLQGTSREARQKVGDSCSKSMIDRFSLPKDSSATPSPFNGPALLIAHFGLVVKADHQLTSPRHGILFNARPPFPHLATLAAGMIQYCALHGGD